EQSLKGSARNPSRSLLLISEIALTFVLVIGAALMVKSFSRLLQVDPGFDAGQVLTFRSTLAKTRFPTMVQTQAYQNDFLARLRMVPGVKAGGITSGLPMSGVSRGTDFRIQGRPDDIGVGRGNARFRAVDAGYFNTLGIRLLEGRFISEHDTASSQHVVIVNQ